MTAGHPRDKLVHRVVDELGAQLGEFIWLRVVERCSKIGARGAARRGPLRPQKIAGVVGRSLLADHVPHAQVVDQQLEQVRLGRVLADTRAVDALPNPSAG